MKTETTLNFTAEQLNELKRIVDTVGWATRNDETGQKKAPKMGANEGMVFLYAFGCTDDCGGIHTAKNAGKILRKLHALF